MEPNKSKRMPGAGPFYFKGNKIGVLLLHGGGGGTCADLKPLAEGLHREREYTIHLPLLPGYGTTPEELKDTPIEAWKAALDEEILRLKKKCEKIIVGGHSMGGIFTLILACKYNLDGIFTISTPIGLQGFAPKLVPIAKFFMKYHPIESKQFKKDTNGKWVGYDKIPINIVLKMKKLIKEMKRSLPKIECPTILFQGRLDTVIKKSSMDYIFKGIKSKDKKMIWLENNDHPILLSPDHDQIELELLKFIETINNF